MTPPTWTGSRTANGCRSPNLPTFQAMSFSSVTAVVGGNFHAIAQRGSRPTTPRRRCSSMSSTLTTTPSISKSSAPRRSCHAHALGDDLVLGVEALDVAVHAEVVRAQPLERVPVARERDALGRPDAVAPHRQRALGGELRVELADRPGGGVARVHERRQALLGAALVQRGEVAERHVDLAADLDQRRGVVDAQRDGRDRAQVVGDVLADHAVAAGRAALEDAVAVEQRDREAVDLRLGDVAELRRLDPLARKVVAHPVDPRAQLLLAARVGEREHRLQVRDLVEAVERLAAGALRRRVGGEQLGVLGLDAAQLVEQRVVGVVADDRVVEDVVAAAVLAQLVAELRRAPRDLRRRAHSTSRAAGASSRARS